MTDLALDRLADVRDHGGDATRARVTAVADNFVELMRSFTRARNRMLNAVSGDVEWSAHLLLKCISNAGPMRASALAECVQSDPSTVSRQVATLVKDGYLERRADPDDGRASLLAVTAKADAVLSAHEERRVDYFVRMLAHWAPDDLDHFAALLARFTDDYENANTQWLAERFAPRSSTTGGNSR